MGALDRVVRFFESEALQELVTRRVDSAWLSAFRLLYGLALSVSMARFLIYGWVERFYVEPNFHFKYWGFSWVEPLGADSMHLLFFALCVLSACIAVGLFFRLSALLFAIGLAYVQLIDVTTYLNHYYLASLLAFLLAASPAGKNASVDQWLRARFGQASTEGSISALWLWLFRFQVGTVYVFAGLAKLNSDWLIHAQPLRIWLGASTDLPLLGPLLVLEGVPLVMSWAGFLFDTTIVLWLSWRRTRFIAYLVLLVFHAITRLLFPIGMFPVIMSVAALMFFEPHWPRQLWGRIRGHTAKAASLLPPTPAPRPSRWTWVAMSVGVLYCMVQIALPLRYLAYGDNVLWHEQGMRLSWRVMLRAKGGEVRFVVSEANSSQKIYVDPKHYLTDLQAVEMANQPDLILQMAHHIADDYEGRGLRQVEVRAETHIALNGRRSAVLIDPQVDLAAQSEGWSSKPWITPAPDRPPIHTRPVL